MLDLLARLVRKSLVTATEEADGGKRYGLLETVREYARQKLVARGTAETSAVRERHAAFYSVVAERFAPGHPVSTVRGVSPLWIAENPNAALTVERFEAVHDNMRAALEWLLEVGRPADGLSLALELGPIWIWRGIYAEARRRVEAMLDLADRTEHAVSRTLRARALGLIGLMASRQGDYAQSRRFIETGAAVWRELDNATELGLALSTLGLALWLEGEPEPAAAVLRESLDLSRAVGDRATVAMTLRNFGMIARSQAQYERAATLFREAISEAQSLGWWGGDYAVARATCHLGRVVYLQGNWQGARTLLRETLVLIREARLAGHTLADCLDWLAAVDGAEGEAGRAARLFGAAEAQWRASGGIRYAPDRSSHEGDLANVRAQLDEHTFAAAWAEGQAMNAEQAVAYALEETDPDDVAP